MRMTDYKFDYYYKFFPILGKLGLIKPRHVKVIIDADFGYSYADVIKTYSGGFRTFKNEV